MNLVGSEFETSDDTSSPDSQTRGSEHGSSWGLDSLTTGTLRSHEAESDRRSEVTTAAEPQAATYNHLMLDRSHSYNLSYSNSTLPPPPGALSSSTRTSSFDSSFQYSPRDYNSSATSSIMSQETSPRSVDMSLQNHRPAYTTYLNQPMLTSGAVTNAILWHPSLHASASAYQQPPY